MLSLTEDAMAAPAENDAETSAALNDLTVWLINRGLEDSPVEEWLEALCDRLVEAGFPLQRVNITMRAHHPEIGSIMPWAVMLFNSVSSDFSFFFIFFFP